MTGPKTNERAGTRATVKHVRASASKAREVLNLIRNQPFRQAEEILDFSERGVSQEITKVLNSAVANAFHNDRLDPEELFVSACYADEGITLKRSRPRARGRATPILKRTCHITVILDRYDEDTLEAMQSRAAAGGGASSNAAQQRRRRVQRSRQRQRASEPEVETATSPEPEPEAEEQSVNTTEAALDKTTEAETSTESETATESEMPPGAETLTEAETSTEAETPTEAEGATATESTASEDQHKPAKSSGEET